MKIYKLMQTELFDAFFSEVKIKEVNQWTVTIPKDAVIVKSVKEGKTLTEEALAKAKVTPRKGRHDRMCEACNRVYAVEYELNEFTMDKVLQLLYKELSANDVQIICEKEPWIAERFQDYLHNQFPNEDFKQEFEKLKTTSQTDQNIKNLAILAFANSMLKNSNNS